MRKEIVIAILVGLSFGLIVVYGVRTAQQSLANRPGAHPTPALTTNSATKTNHTVTITSPDADMIVTTGEVTVIGTTTPLSMVSLVSTGDTNTAVADESGAFTMPFPVSGGLNQLTITSFSPDGDQASTSFNIIYSSADLSATTSAAKKAKGL